MNNLTRALGALTLWCACASAASTVLISDTLKVPQENALFTGTLTISAPDMRRAGTNYKRWVKVYRIEAGVVAITLVPNSGSTPASTRYRVEYAPDSNARPWTREWSVPDSATSLTVDAVELVDVSAPASIPFLSLSQINPGSGPDYCIKRVSGTVVWGACGGAAWGTITGLLDSQTDIRSALDGKSPIAHGHLVSGVTGLQPALDGKEPTLNLGDGLIKAGPTLLSDSTIMSMWTAVSGPPAGSCSPGLWGFNPTSHLVYFCDGIWNALAAGSSYTLPTASDTVKGGVKIGTGLSIDGGGVLSVTGGGGGGTAGGNPSFAFTAQTTVTLAHNLGTKNIGVACYDSSDVAIQGAWSVSGSAPYDATVTFATAQTGRCVVLGGAGKYGQAISGAASYTVAGSTHGLGSCDVQVQVWDNASPAKRVEPDSVTCNGTSKDIVVAFATAQAGRLVIQ